MTTNHIVGLVLALSLVFQVARAEVPSDKAVTDPATIAELAPEPIPDEQNAAVHLERISPVLEAFGKAHGGYIDSPDGEDFEIRVEKGQSPTPIQLASVRKILDDHAVIFDAIEKAASCDEYASQLDFSLAPNEFLQQVIDRVQHVRTLGRAVHWKCVILLADGKIDDAARLGTQMSRVLRLRVNEPLLINYLVTNAVHGVLVDVLKCTILAGPISLEVKSDLLSELKIQEESWLPKVLISERAYAQQNSSNQVFGARGPGGQVVPQLLQWQAKELSVIDNARKVADKSWHDVKGQFKQGAGMDAAMASAFRSESRRIMYVRALQILIALQDYQAKTGEEPKELKYLGIADESLVDPFSGTPLNLKQTDRGWIIYSVMDNGQDDGGNFDDMLDWGLAPPGYSKE